MFQVQLSQKPGTSGARQSKQLTRDTATHCVSNQETGGKKKTTNNKLSNKKWSETAWSERRSRNHNDYRMKSDLQVWSWSGSTSLPQIPARPSVYPKGGAPTTQTSPPSVEGGAEPGSGGCREETQEGGEGPKGLPPRPLGRSPFPKSTPLPDINRMVLPTI